MGLGKISWEVKFLITENFRVLDVEETESWRDSHIKYAIW